MSSTKHCAFAADQTPTALLSSATLPPCLRARSQQGEGDDFVMNLGPEDS